MRRFDQQRDIKHGTAPTAALRLSSLGLHLQADQGVNDGFQLLACAWVSIGQRPHAVPVKRAVRRDEYWPKLLGDRGDGQSAWCRQLPGDGIGIDHGRATFGQQS